MSRRGPAIRGSTRTEAWQSLGAALALVAGLVIGWMPASADVAAPVATPAATVVAVPAATAAATVAAPTAAATVAVVATAAKPTTVAPVATAVAPAPVKPAATAVAPAKPAPAPIRKRGTGADECDPAIYSCPVQMGLKFTNLTGAEPSTFRVGDTVAVAIVARSSVATQSYGFSAYLDFDTADYQLLEGAGDPAEPGDTGVFAVAPSIEGVNVVVMGGVNTYTEYGGTLGKLDLDVRTNASGDPGPYFVLPGNTEVSLATATFRVKRNEASSSDAGDTKFEIALRNSNATVGADGLVDRNSVVAGGPGGDNRNIMSAPMDTVDRDGKPTVVRTHAELLATTTFAAPVRVGDVIPVDIVLRAPPGQYVRHVNAVQATIKVASPTFRVVDNSPSGTGVNDGAGAVWQAPDAAGTRLNLGAGATGTFQVGANPYESEVRLDVTGTNVPSLTPGQSAVVGRMYVQALEKSVAPPSAVTVTMDSGDRAGERLAGAATPTFAVNVVPSGTSGTNDSYQCTTSCATLNLGDVRGTTGITLQVRSPMADNPGLGAATPSFVLASETFAFKGVEGRFLDVAILVEAKDWPTHNREANRFDIDLAADATVSSVVEFISNVSAGVTVRDGAGHSIASKGDIRLRLDKSAVATATFEVGRLRLRLADPAATSMTAYRAVTVKSSTTLRVDGGPIDDIYADPVNGAPTGEFDRNAHVVNQPAASLQIGARLQGRRPTDPDARFQQPVDVILLKSNRPALRLLTPEDHDWTFAPVEAASTTFTFRAATASPTFGSQASGCDNWGPAPGGPSNVVLATGTFSAGELDSVTGPCQIDSIEPGTYDVYVKGQSSVGVRVTDVPFLPGQFRTLSGLVLREGDILQGGGDTDNINGADYTAFSTAYNGYPGNAGPAGWNQNADLNQSGYIDILDFSLLAMNYNATGATSIPTIDLGNALTMVGPASAPASATQTFSVTLSSPTFTFRRAAISVRARDSGVIAITCLTGDNACHGDDDSEGVHLGFQGGGTDASVTRQFEVKGTGVGETNLVIHLEETEGASGANRAFFSAHELSRPYTVLPDVTWTLSVDSLANSDKFTAQIDAILATGITNHGGEFEISYPVAKLSAECPTANSIIGLDCAIDDTPDANGMGTVTLTFSDAIFITNGAFVLGPVTFQVAGSVGEAGAIFARWTSMPVSADAGETSDYSIELASSTGKMMREFEISEDSNHSAIISAQRVRTTSVRTSSVRARSTSPNANLWVRTGATDIKAGDVIPVTVGVTTGTRAIDGAQVVLRTGTGVQLVDRDGNPVTSASTLDVATGGALPSLLHRALDAGRGLIELAFGRQVSQSISGVSGEATLGTIYLKVTGPVTGDLLTIERQGGGRFATLVAGDGDDLTGTLVGLSSSEVVNVPVEAAPVASAPVIGGTAGTAYLAPAPAASAGPAPAAAPARSGAPATSTSARPSVTTSRAIVEDRARHVISVTVPGRAAPVELKAGLATTAPDQFCPVARHRSYIRLQDVGIAGATFGVGDGGVLSWVTPDQAGCVDWGAIAAGNLSFGKEVIMQFALDRAAPGALLWVLDGTRFGELYEVNAFGIATYVTAEAFAANQDHFTKVWANVIPVSTMQVDGLAARAGVVR